MFIEVSEVSVTYRLDEVSLELLVTLPEDYPLHPPSVKEGKRVRVESSQWRKWMLQLNIFLTNQVTTSIMKLYTSHAAFDCISSTYNTHLHAISVIHGLLSCTCAAEWLPK